MRATFDEETKYAAFLRQGKRCAGCGKELAWENYEKGDWGAWHAHHMDGDRGNDTLSNCVCLCVNEPEYCHLRIGHVGDFTGNSVASRSSYRYLGM